MTEHEHRCPHCGAPWACAALICSGPDRRARSCWPCRQRGLDDPLPAGFGAHSTPARGAGGAPGFGMAARYSVWHVRSALVRGRRGGPSVSASLSTAGSGT